MLALNHVVAQASLEVHGLQSKAIHCGRQIQGDQRWMNHPGD